MMIPVRVVADERERASGVPEELSKLNVRVYFSKLSVGDYVLSPEVAVERKSIPDLISSVYDSRIFNQASRIASAFAKPYLLIEGDSKDVERLTRNLKSYYGAIASVTLAYGLRVLFTANKTETAVAISELLRNVRARPVPHQMSEAPPRSKSASSADAELGSRQAAHPRGHDPRVGDQLPRLERDQRGAPVDPARPRRWPDGAAVARRLVPAYADRA